MKRLWMPLYIANYLKDKTQLGALESGAYLHLIMAYWVSGKLPNDDKRLATIAKMSMRQWRASRATLAAFFGPDWTHKRIEDELKRANAIAESSSERARQAANARWAKDASSDAPGHANGTAQALPGDAQLESPSQPPARIQKLAGHLGEEVKARKTPPHGAVGKGRIWISAASQDWTAYAEDYRAAHGEYPTVDPERGGKWFRVAGEQARSA
jgi:uncharacterized protein YdaU (DUF1376 family)